MKINIRNLCIGVLLSSALVMGGNVAANADEFPDPTTSTEGTLQLATHQYSNSTVDVYFEYSSTVAADTEVQVVARDAESGKVAQSVTMDNSFCLHERVMDGLDYRHNYIFSASLVWKDGSRKIDAAPVRQDMAYTDTVHWMKYEAINQDVPANQLGWRDCVVITEGSYKLDTVASGAAPSAAAAKQLRASTSQHGIKLTWQQGKSVAKYTVAAKPLTKGVKTKRASVGASHKTYSFKGLKRNTAYLVSLTTVSRAGNKHTLTKLVHTR